MVIKSKRKKHNSLYVQFAPLLSEILPSVAVVKAYSVVNASNPGEQEITLAPKSVKVTKMSRLEMFIDLCAPKWPISNLIV